MSPICFWDCRLPSYSRSEISSTFSCRYVSISLRSSIHHDRAELTLCLLLFHSVLNLRDLRPNLNNFFDVLKFLTVLNTTLTLCIYTVLKICNSQADKLFSSIRSLKDTSGKLSTQIKYLNKSIDALIKYYSSKSTCFPMLLE